MTFSGKGFYLWNIERAEVGNVNSIANLAVQAGLTHILVKIADEDEPYNLHSVSGADLVPPLVAALHDRGLEVWGWHYVYGYKPVEEADMAITRLRQLNLDGYVIDAESEYELPGRETAARTFMSRLRNAYPTFPVGLSSFRYPSYHPGFPFQAFLEKCDINMPQVYWVGRHDPGDQLTRCVREFQAISPFRPIIPTGSAYYSGSWIPTSADITEFMDTARTLNLAAANFWEWYHTRLYLPGLWNTIAAYNWEGGIPETEIVSTYIAALNAHDPARAAALYQSNAVHVTADRTLQGANQILGWYQTLLTQLLPNATFTLVEETGRLGARTFRWTATSSNGQVTDGQDSFGLSGGLIVYHYTSFTITR